MRILHRAYICTIYKGNDVSVLVHVALPHLRLQSKVLMPGLLEPGIEKERDVPNQQWARTRPRRRDTSGKTIGMICKALGLVCSAWCTQTTQRLSIYHTTPYGGVALVRATHNLRRASQSVGQDIGCTPRLSLVAVGLLAYAILLRLQTCKGRCDSVVSAVSSDLPI